MLWERVLDYEWFRREGILVLVLFLIKLVVFGKMFNFFYVLLV